MFNGYKGPEDNLLEYNEEPLAGELKNEDQSSHKLIYALKKYAQFAKFSMSSLMASLIDIAFFTIFINFNDKIGLANGIVLATVSARILSSIYNFIVNRKRVFKCDNNVKPVVVKFTLLSLVKVYLSSVLVIALNSFIAGYMIVAKVIVDTILFVLSFGIQKEWVF